MSCSQRSPTRGHRFHDDQSNVQVALAPTNDRCSRWELIRFVAGIAACGPCLAEYGPRNSCGRNQCLSMPPIDSSFDPSARSCRVLSSGSGLSGFALGKLALVAATRPGQIARHARPVRAPGTGRPFPDDSPVRRMPRARLERRNTPRMPCGRGWKPWERTWSTSCHASQTDGRRCAALVSHPHGLLDMPRGTVASPARGDRPDHRVSLPRVRTSSDSRVRRDWRPLARLASKHQCAIILFSAPS